MFLSPEVDPTCLFRAHLEPTEKTAEKSSAICTKEDKMLIVITELLPSKAGIPALSPGAPFNCITSAKWQGPADTFASTYRFIPRPRDKRGPSLEGGAPPAPFPALNSPQAIDKDGQHFPAPVVTKRWWGALLPPCWALQHSGPFPKT